MSQTGGTGGQDPAAGQAPADPNAASVDPTAAPADPNVGPAADPYAQGPAADPAAGNGSDWYTMRSREVSQPGLLVFSVSKDGWDDLRIL
ncbi:hypothetical protein AB0D86_46695 [Streptomyces sp. NPDC048324]|uniref:hypothetical protein n=1 Tax=Streptomyces sp. NPDC048324 TaxID=3157205 RepID=UPI00341BAF07